MKLFRTMHGDATVHVESCPYLKRAKKKYEWIWAEGKTSTEIFWNARNKPCKKCMKAKSRTVED